MARTEAWGGRCQQACCTSVFQELTEEEFQELTRLMHPVEYAKGERIFQPGSPVFGCYVLCQGAVRLVQQPPKGKRLRQVVRLLRRPALFGETSLFTGETHWVFAETLTPTQLIILPGKAFLEYLQTHPALMVRLLEKLAREVKAMQAKLLEMTYAGAEERLAGVLVQLGEEFGQPLPDGSVDIQLELLRAELGELAGLSAETTIRLLRQWVERGLVQTKGRYIRLLDLENLRWIAGLAEQAPASASP